jgi:hypothetical protein
MTASLTTTFARMHAWEAMAPERSAAAREQARAILRPLDDNHSAQLDGRCAHLRRYVPAPDRGAALRRRPRRAPAR